MQTIKIKKKVIKSNDTETCLYYVQALALKNSDKKVKLLVPHPNGNDVMEFSTLAEAAAAIRKAGFEYKLPEGEEITKDVVNDFTKKPVNNNIEKILYNKFKAKSEDINSSIVASSITALSYLNSEDAINIFIDKLGEDNEKIRTAAIDALINHHGYVVDKLIDTLSSPNWVSRNSAITCLVKISEYTNVEIEKILIPMINRIDDENPIVQANAILATAKIYNNYKKRQEK